MALTPWGRMRWHTRRGWTHCLDSLFSEAIYSNVLATFLFVTLLLFKHAVEGASSRLGVTGQRVKSHDILPTKLRDYTP